MTKPSHCLSSNDMRVFLSGHSTQVQDSATVSHLDCCSACRNALEEIAGGAKWRGYVQELLSSAGCEAASEDRITGTYPLDDTFLVANRLTFLAPTDDPRMIGRLGFYEVSGVIGYGGMGVILKALEPALNRHVALKVLWPHLAAHGAARQRFAREARAAAAVVHEHVVPIYSVDENQGLPYIVMQYVPGRSLQDRISRDGALSIEQVLRIGRQIASALSAAHAQGLVHRDIKPGNILLERSIERVLVTDFGLAQAADDASLTHSGMVAGTPPFMSPEQARGELIDHRSDLFSLGSVLYTMCAGHPPFRAATTMGALTRICNDAARPLREINSAVPQWLDAFIARLMDKDPSRRFQTAIEVARILENELAHIQNPLNVSRPDRAWISSNRTRSIRPFTVAVGVAIICFLILLRSWYPAQLFPTNNGGNANRIAQLEEAKLSVVESPGFSVVDASSDDPITLRSLLNNTLNDPTEAEIAELQIKFDDLEQRQLTPRPLDVWEAGDPWSQARQAAAELERKLAPTQLAY